MRAFVGKDVRVQRALLAAWDLGAWFIATLALAAARYDFSLNAVQWQAALAYVLLVSVAQLVGAWWMKLYRGHSRIGSFEEASALAVLAIVIGFSIGTAFIAVVPDFPRGIALTVPMGALTVMAAGRFVARAYLTRASRRKASASDERVLIYGAGNAGRQLGRLLVGDPDAPYSVVGYIDDDPFNRHLHLTAGRVIGRRGDLVRLAELHDVKTVILAIPSAPTSFLRDLVDELEGSGLKLLVLPSVREMVGGRVSLGHLHEVDVADLLGRGQVDTDLTQVSQYLNGRVVLITGAGGSIGSELARQVHRLGPSKLVLLDRDESGLHAVQLSIYGQGLLDTRDMVLCDIRDAESVRRVFGEHRPEVVFHAAALKHLPMLEMYPEEGFKTNVLGTLNVLEAARQYGVRHVVNISTDKAADPTSVLGKTKRTAEELTAWFAEQGAGGYLSVRFGNVLGSRGSVLHAFRAQIEAGGPVTVVHPEITRYFMTIPEACQLVIQAGAIGEPGAVCVLDMGEPVKILDVAQRLIRQSGKDVEIVFTGLRHGEKLHEVLFSSEERAERVGHPLISQVSVQPLAPDSVEGRVLARSIA
ncbi:polysaccharide biosynthesis protein [Aestuariimicrobium ganziense]|uniref:polysaccharide biosynthesis protein n=1 Tax=Aestuariimicrobium ganziense TaxID=2773677 RepID=UPI001940872F|nr:nucleoside-diphosphate sugar epimerase/dehydratase [Aestuariimicrobium ganziense]